MKIVSVNVGLPREVAWKGKVVSTGIFKELVHGRVRLAALNLDGDRQADLSVHGGLDKAVYAYPAEHYDYWRGELQDLDLPWGMFGENFTTEGLLEEAVYIGDRFRIGSAVLMVTQPRIPCYKLAVKFGRDDIIKRFLMSGRSGFYLSVVEEGEVGAGDVVELIHRDQDSVTAADIVRLYVRDKQNLPLMQQAMRISALPAGWRDYFRKRLEQGRTA
jgi:MOSC domain-containing protein YiiM